MADCNYTCFDRVLHQVTPLNEEDLLEAHDIALDGSLDELLDFMVEKGCCSKEQSQTLYEGIVMWEDLDGNYWEEDYDKYMSLQDKIGLTKEKCEELENENQEMEQ